ncbi:short-subunit dehydrogenase [Bradyrhizobium sp. GM5.1]
MDLGIKGRRAIVCASSKGLGRACAISLAEAGVHVTLTARGAEALKKTADDIRKAYPDVTVTEIVGDITTPAGREAVLKAVPRAGHPDQQCRRTSARRFPQLDPRRLD